MDTDLIGVIGGVRISLDDFEYGDTIGDVFAETDESDDDEPPECGFLLRGESKRRRLDV